MGDSDGPSAFERELLFDLTDRGGAAQGVGGAASFLGFPDKAGAMPSESGSPRIKRCVLTSPG